MRDARFKSAIQREEIASASSRSVTSAASDAGSDD
jgi:hypothetical protein